MPNHSRSRRAESTPEFNTEIPDDAFFDSRFDPEDWLDEIREIPRVDDTDYEPRIVEFNQHLGTSKRQGFGFLILMMASLGISSAFSIISSKKLAHFSEILDGVVDSQNILVEKLSKTNKEVLTNHHAIKDLSRLVRLVTTTIQVEDWKMNGIYRNFFPL